ncbi:MAG: ATP synthase subunit I [Rhodocyclaceae bacterium]|nr:ATP synthase subunit I [Rhodocyclaceae bacterium]
MSLRARAYVLRRPVRWALASQTLVTLAAAALAWVWVGLPAAWSAALGGAVAVAGSLAYAVVAGRPVDGLPLSALRGLIRAEAAKVLVVVLLLWTVFKSQAAPHMAAFFMTFVLVVLAFSVAALVRDR